MIKYDKLACATVPDADINIIVEKVRVEGNGVILLTGPSSCGKGEIANALRGFLSVPEDRHLSMGELLRRTIRKGKDDKNFREKLGTEYGIKNDTSIFDEKLNRIEIVNKAMEYSKELDAFFQKEISSITQLDWLEFCVSKGLLVPDEWTVKIIDAIFESSSELQKGILILDGYPRTTIAAQNLLKTFSRLNIPIIKVLHLSITKQEMKSRALNRNRLDDTEESLDRRYQFYVDKVQPCIDYFKQCLGVNKVALIDAHQPFYNSEGKLNIEASIHQVTIDVMNALGLPEFLLQIK
jgi:adenylate kinase family enzyme